jgi:hypothetical protein
MIGEISRVQYAKSDYRCKRCGHLHGSHWIDELIDQGQNRAHPGETPRLFASWNAVGRGCDECDCSGLK